MPDDEKPKLDYASPRKPAGPRWPIWLDRIAVIIAGFIVIIFLIAIVGGCMTGLIFWLVSRRGG